jgi:hemerythrin-like domain-containing protein
MDPVKQIMEEHRVIERAVDVLEKIMDGLEEGIKLPPELILTDIGLIMEFTDEFHLEKEEGILISFMEEIGKPDFKEKIQYFLDQHKTSTKYIKAIYEAMEFYDDNNLEAASIIIENGREYIKQFRPMFEKEDKTVFIPLRNSLSKDEIAQLEEKFKDFEYAWSGPQLFNYQKMVRELERKSTMTVW